MALGFKAIHYSLAHLLLSLFLIICFISTTRSVLTQERNGSSEMSPVTSLTTLNSTIFADRRRLGSFQICALCTCCGGPRGLCLPSPCCYAINCNIPNRPFGYCSFTPKTCNCFGCHL